MVSSKRILMISAEASSALYGLRILQEWQREGRDYQVYGIGSRDMEESGLECLGYAEDLAVVGFREVLSKYKEIKKVYGEVLRKVNSHPPDVAVLLDYPGFNLRLAKELKKKRIKVLYYIAPQVWAWRKGRVKTIRRYVDEVLCILPFEENFYKEHGVNARFVGHPLLDEFDTALYSEDVRSVHRGRFFFTEEDQVLGLMPGSRHGELKYNFPVQLSVAKKLHLKYPKLKIAILVAPTLKREELMEYLQEFKCPYVVIQDEPLKMIQMVDVMLCKSGTSTLMVGLMGVPMVIMYKVSFLTGIVGKILVSGFIGLVNIIMNKEIVPERIQGEATERELEALLERIMKDDTYSCEMKDNLKKLKEKLENGKEAVTQGVRPKMTVGQNVASIIEGYL